MRFTRNILKDYARLCNLSYRSGEEMCETYTGRAGFERWKKRTTDGRTIEGGFIEK